MASRAERLKPCALTVSFLSDPSVVAEIIPPPLEPAAEPRATVTVATIGRSNCVGPFDGASINLACHYGGEDGFYCLTMPMSTDTAVVFGRELYAEPKKLAEIALEVDVERRRARGTVRRHGITYIEIEAKLEMAVSIWSAPASMALSWHMAPMPAVSWLCTNTGRSTSALSALTSSKVA